MNSNKDTLVQRDDHLNRGVIADGVPQPAISLLMEYMTIEEFARELNKHPRTINRWLALGEGPPITKVGRQRLIRRRGAGAWLASLEKAQRA